MKWGEMEKQGQKRFFVKSYRYLWQLENAIRTIRRRATSELQMSVLGKLSPTCKLGDKRLLEAKNEWNAFWKRTTGLPPNFSSFCNPDMGTLFVIGAVATQFLHHTGGKALGEIASGPFGILRGLGVGEGMVSTCLKDLDKRCYLFILRGYEHELDTLEKWI
ncbi:hypothetical protein [Pseudozobellia thermophila]|uniref:Uncharacterized protein n=1 Tax=Pseudozobellia thermophila TaxID=192903 RepID=A0A1M6IK40_9FLAO|nr:hypothetical protein [Pseudozobellia thermophila]SHJ34775.1 hypothetical protein SAMN04488513_10414 [Pseudozobellia thermophila]